MGLSHKKCKCLIVQASPSSVELGFLFDEKGFLAVAPEKAHVCPFVRLSVWCLHKNLLTNSRTGQVKRKNEFLCLTEHRTTDFGRFLRKTISLFLGEAHLPLRPHMGAFCDHRLRLHVCAS